MVSIQRAHAAEISEIFALVRRAVVHMNALGNPQWDENYPTRADYGADLDRGDLYAARSDTGALLGVACINTSEAPEYAAVPWSSPGPAVVIHRMAVDPCAQHQGVGRALFCHAEAYARSLGVGTMRIDTYGQNDRMQALILRCGFVRVGEICLHSRPLKFPCFEKCLR